MALHSHRFPINITTPYWIVFGGDDVPEGKGRMFTERAEVEHYLSGFYRLPYQVHEADPDTGKLWDATVEFDGTLDIEREPFEPDYAHSDGFAKLYREAR